MLHLSKPSHCKNGHQIMFIQSFKGSFMIIALESKKDSLMQWMLIYIYILIISDLGVYPQNCKPLCPSLPETHASTQDDNESNDKDPNANQGNLEGWFRNIVTLPTSGPHHSNLPFSQPHLAFFQR